MRISVNEVVSLQARRADSQLGNITIKVDSRSTVLEDPFSVAAVFFHHPDREHFATKSLPPFPVCVDYYQCGSVDFSENNTSL
jgi:hypothetical protein